MDNQEKPTENQGGNQDSNSNNQPDDFHPIDMDNKKPSNFITIATVLIIIAIIVIISNTFKEKEPKQQINNDKNLTVEIGDSHIENNDISINPEEVLTKANFLELKDFSDLKRAEKIINSSQGKNPGTKLAEFIQAGIIPDQEKENIYYFATSTKNTNSNFVGIYEYNKETANWHRLTKTTFIPQNGHTGMWRVLAKQGDNLIVLKDVMNHQISDCDSWLLQGDNQNSGLFTLKISGSSHNLTPYELSKNIKQNEEQKVESCLHAK